MNKKVLSAGLCLSLVLGAYNIADASENNKTKNNEMTTMKEERHNYLFKVTDVTDKEISLAYDGEMTNVAYERDLTVDKVLKLDKSLFKDDVKVKDTYMVKSKKQVKDLMDKDITKEDISLSAAYEKPVNIDYEKLPKDAKKIGLEVVEVNGETATLADMDNPESKYMASFDDLRDEDVKVGDIYTLFWDGMVMESYPAQFGRIYRVEKAEVNYERDKSKKTQMEFEVVEKNEGGVTLAEVGNKDNLYSISLKDLKDDKPEIGDRYMITWNGISLKSYPAQFGEIYSVEKRMRKDSAKLVSKDKLGEAIKKAEGIVLGDNTYTKESVDVYKKAYDEAKKVNDNADADQTLVNKATDDLLAAIDNLSQKEGVIKKEFKISQFIEKGGKNVELQSVDYPDKKFTLNFESLNDKDAKVGDRYIVTISKIDPKASPFEMGEITKIEKVVATNEDKKSDSDVKKDDKKDQVVDKKDNAPKENKQTMFGNPKTGVGSVAPLLGVIAGASALLKKER